MNASNESDSPQASQTPSCASQGELCDAFAILQEGASPREKASGKRIVVCHRDELPQGAKRIVNDGKWSAGVFNVQGRFHAVRNICPHAGAPLCEGSVSGTHQPSDVGQFNPQYAGRILRCPWHGWEFDIVTGKGLYDRNSRVATYPVEVDENGMIVVIR